MAGMGRLDGFRFRPLACVKRLLRPDLIFPDDIPLR